MLTVHIEYFVEVDDVTKIWRKQSTHANHTSNAYLQRLTPSPSHLRFLLVQKSHDARSRPLGTAVGARRGVMVVTGRLPAPLSARLLAPKLGSFFILAIDSPGKGQSVVSGFLAVG